jgi:membrane associated rhomboid family serine protease
MTILCPHCRHNSLEPLHHHDIELDACLHCGGLWFDRYELDKIVHLYDPNYPRKGAIVDTLGPPIAATQKKCPRCQDAALYTYEFEQGRDLKIDVCPACEGIWLEKGELDQAKIFYEIPEAVERIEQKTTWAHWLFQFLFHLPVEFNVKPRKFPLITVALLILNGLLFLPIIMAQVPNDIWYGWGLIPQEWGSIGWFITLFTHQFLHGGWAHLIGNMYFLYILGDNVEDAMGRSLFTVFYLFCGLIAGLTHVAYELVLGGGTHIPLIGASGAISGVMAAYMYIFRKAKLTFMLVIFQYKLSPIWYFGIWLATNVLFLILGAANVSWMAHIGGFFAGLLFSYFVYDQILKANPLIRHLNQS